MLLIKNGCIHNGLGDVLPCTDILVENGKIKTVAKGLTAPDATVVDAAGMDIFPGFIDAVNMYGCKGPGWRDNDADEASDPVLPQMNVVYGFDHDAMNFQELYKYGVTASGICPMPSNVMGGQLAVFKTHGRSPYAMLIRENAASAASVTPAVKSNYAPKNLVPMTRMGAFSLLTEALKKALRYDPKSGYDDKCEALLPVVNGEIPLFVNCGTRAEMDALMLALKPFDKLKTVLTGAFGLTCDFAAVAERHMPVIMGDLSEAMSAVNANVAFADIISMIEGGNEIAISCAGDSYASGKESLLWNAILWHKNGLDAELAIKAITSTPAKILGVSNKIGAIEAGMDADFSIWSEHPIKTFNARLQSVYMNGENLLEKERYSSCW